jgi:hypothetical protein
MHTTASPVATGLMCDTCPFFDSKDIDEADARTWSTNASTSRLDWSLGRRRCPEKDSASRTVVCGEWMSSCSTYLRPRTRQLGCTELLDCSHRTHEDEQRTCEAQ